MLHAPKSSQAVASVSYSSRIDGGTSLLRWEQWVWFCFVFSLFVDSSAPVTWKLGIRRVTMKSWRNSNIVKSSADECLYLLTKNSTWPILVMSNRSCRLWSARGTVQSQGARCHCTCIQGCCNKPFFFFKEKYWLGLKNKNKNKIKQNKKKPGRLLQKGQTIALRVKFLHPCVLGYHSQIQKKHSVLAEASIRSVCDFRQSHVQNGVWLTWSHRFHKVFLCLKHAYKSRSVDIQAGFKKDRRVAF